MYGPRDIRDLHQHSQSSENLSATFIANHGHNSDNILTIPVPAQRDLRAARSAENLTTHQHKRPLPSVPHHTLGKHNHTPGTPPKPASRFPSPGPSPCPSPYPSNSSIDTDSGSRQMLINKLTPRPSVTSLDAVTLSSTDCLGDDLEGYKQAQRRLTAGVVLLGGVMLVLLVLVSLGLVWCVTYQAPRHRMVAAHVVINSTLLKLQQQEVQPRIAAQRSGRLTSCEKGTELRPWITDKGTTTLRGIEFNTTTNRLVIADPGHYFVYSQVVFHKVGNKTENDPISDSLFHVVCKTSPHNPNPKDLLQATETPNKVEDWREETALAFHTSHISGIVPLLRGDEIYVKVSNLHLVQPVSNARTIFTGLFRLPTAGADPGM